MANLLGKRSLTGSRMSLHSAQPALARPACSVAPRRRRTQIIKAQAAAVVEEKKVKYERPDVTGRYGKYGGKYVPETLIPALAELEAAYKLAKADPAYQVRGLDHLHSVFNSTTAVRPAMLLLRSASIQLGYCDGARS